VIHSFPGVRYFHQDNAGHVAAFNRGYAESRGDVVLFLDADDVLEPDAIAEVVACWRSGAAKLQYELSLSIRLCCFRN
jgi:glycosyltransferase involved in cell wall biosynthesis